MFRIHRGKMIRSTLAMFRIQRGKCNYEHLGYDRKHAVND